jgi:hypothetical protein
LGFKDDGDLAAPQTLLAIPKARLYLAGLGDEVRAAPAEVLSLASGLVVSGDGTSCFVRLVNVQ